jgi:hypothetical protein
MLPFEKLVAFLGQVKIAHHIRGRIRLKLLSYPQGLSPSELHPQHFQSIVERIPGVRSVRINILAGSCLVDYDPAMIPDQAWKDFIAGENSAAAVILEQILRATHQEIIHAKL